jgi:hypothetical protein
MLKVSITLLTANGKTKDKPAVRMSAKQAAAIKPL